MEDALMAAQSIYTRTHTLHHRHTQKLMDMMHLKQTLSILALCLLCACAASRCYTMNELEDAAEKKLVNRFPRLHEPREESRRTDGCTAEMFAQPPVDQTVSSRSLSPWIYQRIENADYFPSTYMEAKCLCTGCIQFSDGKPIINNDYNSVLVSQSRVFLKREPCTGEQTVGRTYRLTPTLLNVGVACTCVRPKKSETRE